MQEEIREQSAFDWHRMPSAPASSIGHSAKCTHKVSSSRKLSIISLHSASIRAESGKCKAHGALTGPWDAGGCAPLASRKGGLARGVPTGRLCGGGKRLALWLAVECQKRGWVEDLASVSGWTGALRGYFIRWALEVITRQMRKETPTRDVEELARAGWACDSVQYLPTALFHGLPSHREDQPALSPSNTKPLAFHPLNPQARHHATCRAAQ